MSIKKEVMDIKVYLLKAFLEWAWDQNIRVYIVAQGSAVDLYAVRDMLKNGHITLNLSAGAITKFAIDDNCLDFHARFNTVDRHVVIPLNTILGIYTPDLVGKEGYQELQWVPEPATGYIPVTEPVQKVAPAVVKPFLRVVK
jgi:stringent starvation protein B